MWEDPKDKPKKKSWWERMFIEEETPEEIEQEEQEEEDDMADDVIEAGNIVQLVSGGPDMTVTKVEGDQVTCIWFPDDGMTQDVLQTATFPMFALELT